jgi:serine protease Do
MAKIEPRSSPPLRSPPPAPAPARAATPPAPGLMLVYRMLKLAAIVGGFPASLLCVMAMIGALTDNIYVRLLGALAAILAIPLIIADRLLPANQPTKARGLVGDVLAVIWLLTAFLIAVVGGGSTQPLLTREGDRLVRGGYPAIAKITYLLAGVDADIPPAPDPAPSSASSASAPPLTSAAPADAGAEADSAPVDAGEAKDAGKAAPTGKAEKTPVELFKELSPSVVTIFIKQNGGGREGGGTGFIVDKDGTIATNHHVIDKAGAVRVKFQNGSIYENLELLLDEAATDLALLRVDLSTPLDGGARPNVVPLVLSDSEAIVVGERAISIGNPLGLEHTLTDGLVSSRRIYENRAWIQFSAPISPGNSGGPLFNMRGEVIGVTTASILGFGVAQNLNLAVPVNELKKLFRPVYPGRRKFGDGSAPSQW